MITADELAIELKVKKQTIYNWVSMRKIPAYKQGGGLRFNLEEVRAKIIKKR